MKGKKKILNDVVSMICMDGCQHCKLKMNMGNLSGTGCALNKLFLITILEAPEDVVRDCLNRSTISASRTQIQFLSHKIHAHRVGQKWSKIEKFQMFKICPRTSGKALSAIGTDISPLFNEI